MYEIEFHVQDLKNGGYKLAENMVPGQPAMFKLPGITDILVNPPAFTQHIKPVACQPDDPFLRSSAVIDVPMERGSITDFLSKWNELIREDLEKRTNPHVYLQEIIFEGVIRGNHVRVVRNHGLFELKGMTHVG